MASLTKKAFEVEFHWIFILIAGAVILGFFFMIAQKQKNLSTERLATTISGELESAFVAALQSKGTAQIMNTPTEGMSFSCGETNVCACSYSFLDKEYALGDLLLFPSKEITEPQAIIWTLDWKTPFRATNFLYLANPTTKYVIVKSDDLVVKQFETKLIRDLPSTLKTQIVDDISHIVYDAKKTRIIFLVEPPATLSQLTQGKDVTAVFIQPPATLEFYTRKSVNKEFIKTAAPFIIDSAPFDQAINDAFLYAAFFAEDPHLYTCQLRKAYTKLSSVAAVIHSRTTKISSEITTNKPHCTGYQHPLGLISTLKNNAQSISQGNNIPPGFLTLTQNLQTANKALLIANCPTIY